MVGWAGEVRRALGEPSTLTSDRLEAQGRELAEQTRGAERTRTGGGTHTRGPQYVSDRARFWCFSGRLLKASGRIWNWRHWLRTAGARRWEAELGAGRARLLTRRCRPRGDGLRVVVGEGQRSRCGRGRGRGRGMCTAGG